MYYLTYEPKTHTPWNKGRLIGKKAPLRLNDIWAIRIHLQMAKDLRNLALFNLALDSKLRACDLVKLKVSDVAPNGEIGKRAKIIQQKTNQPVQFEITQQTRDSLKLWIQFANLSFHDYLFPVKMRLGWIVRLVLVLMKKIIRRRRLSGT